MHKSIFFKYFAIFSSLAIICISIMGLTFVYLAFGEVMASENSDLIRNLEITRIELLNNYDSSDDVFAFNAMARYFNTVTTSNNHIVFVTDASGETIYCTLSEHCDTVHRKVEDSTINAILRNGDYSEFGYLGGIFTKRIFNSGLPIYLDDGSLIGFVFAGSQDYFDDDTILHDVVRIFGVCAMITLALNLIGVFFITRKMVSPLGRMSDAAKRFAVGDFTQKIDVDSVDEMGQLALAMNNMALALEISENAHKSFVANVSHELRTPMTSISGFVDGILDGTIPPEREVHYLNIVSDEIKRLSRLVRTMLNLSRIENGELVLDVARTNIVDIICETLFSFEREIERKKIRLEGIENEKVFVMIDYDLIHQVLYNLIENAVKFVDEGGYIKFTYVQQVDSTIIGIENSGRGLSKDELPKIFDRFYKTDSSRGEDKNGVGLGLHIVRSIVNLHKGEVMVQSSQDNYCKFSFSLPDVRPEIDFEMEGSLQENPFIL